MPKAGYTDPGFTPILSPSRTGYIHAYTMNTQWWPFNPNRSLSGVAQNRVNPGYLQIRGTLDSGPSGWTGSEPLPDRPVHEYAMNTQWCPFNPYRYMTGPAQEGSN